MKKIVIALLLLAFFGCNISAQTKSYICKFIKGISFGNNQQEYIITNDGDSEHEFLNIKFKEQISQKYNMSIIPGMFLIIQKDDPYIDVMNVVTYYMKYFQDNFKAVGVKPDKMPRKIKGYSDQVNTIYTYKNQNITLMGNLFVGKDSGLLYIAYSSSTDDLFESSTEIYTQILDNLQINY